MSQNIVPKDMNKSKEKNVFFWRPAFLDTIFKMDRHCAERFNALKSNVYKSGTLSSAARECHSLNCERRRSATPFYQQERCGSGPHIFEESDIRAALFPPSFFLAFFFSDVHVYCLVKEFSFKLSD